MNEQQLYTGIGQRIRDVRKDAGISRNELGKQIGLTGQSLYRYENGKPIPVGTLVQIADALHVDPCFLLTGHNEGVLVPVRVMNQKGDAVKTLTFPDTVVKENSLCIMAGASAADNCIQPFDLCLVDTAMDFLKMHGRSIVAVRNDDGTIRFLFLSVIDEKRAMFYDGHCTCSLTNDSSGFSLLGRVYRIVRDM